MNEPKEFHAIQATTKKPWPIDVIPIIVPRQGESIRTHARKIAAQCRDCGSPVWLTIETAVRVHTLANHLVGGREFVLICRTCSGEYNSDEVVFTSRRKETSQ